MSVERGPDVTRYVSSRYDLLLAFCGFERRSRFVPGLLKDSVDRASVSAFDTRQVHSFAENMDWFRDAGWAPKVQSEVEFEAAVRDELRGVIGQGEALTIAVDTSSATRTRVASLLAALLDADSDQSVTLDLLYAPARFVGSPILPPPIEYSGVVHHRFAGATADPMLPLVALMGLGMEPERSVGALELLEPVSWWAFVPRGVDKQYDDAVANVNALLEGTFPRGTFVDYDVLDPVQIFIELESLVAGLEDEARIVMMPFGPKMFAIVCLFVAAIHRSAFVWRVSGGALEMAHDHDANGEVAALRVILSPPSIDGKQNQI